MNRQRALIPVAIVAGAVTSAAGCGSASQPTWQSEAAALRGQVEAARRDQEASARELSRLAEEVKALNAQSAFLVGEAKATRDDLSRITPMVEADHDAVPELRASLEELRKSANAAPGPARAGAASSPDDMYAAAMASLQGDDFKRAVQAWTELTKAFPEHPLASNAQYWIGEAAYRQREFRQALIEFRKVIDGYAKSSQVPEALLKIGLCYRALKDPTHAREAWEQLTTQYPATSAADQARVLLAATPSGRARP